MNKDMINIDDFVRDKLGGREEKEDPAAWIRMKELLDKEMPERAIPVGFRFGKPLAFLGCALLATIISVGGYQLLHQEHTGTTKHTTTAAPTQGSGSGSAAQQAAPADLKTPGTTGTPAAHTATHSNVATNRHTAATAYNNTPAQNATATQSTGTGSGRTISNGNSSRQQASTTAPGIASAHTISRTHAGASGHSNTAANADAQQAGYPAKAAASTGDNNTLATTAAANRDSHNSTAAQHQVKNASANGSKNINKASGHTAATTAKIVPQSGTNVTAAGQADPTAPGNAATTTAGSVAQKNKTTRNNNTAGKTRTASGTAANGQQQTALKEQNPTTATAAATAEETGSKENATATPRSTQPDGSTAAAGNTPALRTKDSITAVKVINRTEASKTPSRRPIYSSDTIAMGKVAVPETPSGAQEAGTATGASPTAATSGKVKRSTMRKAAAANKKMNQAATGQAASPDQKVLAANTAVVKTGSNAAGTGTAVVPNSATAATQSTTAEKKKKRSNAFAFINNIHWDEVKENVKYDIGHAQFHFGVAGGANYSLSQNNSFTGFQFGATGELVFNKHLSLMGELKYFNRSGARKMIDDSYVKESARPDSFNSAGNWFTVFTDSSHRDFNFSTLHSFELPVTLRYAVRKFYLMTGINLGYYLGVNVEEIGTKYQLPSKSIVINAAQPILRDTRELDIRDFGSRFAIGYVFGAGYQVSPSVQLDLRVVNTFWDNANTSGAKHLSKDFYKIPSIQLTLGYRFNQGEKTRPGFGPNSQP